MKAEKYYFEFDDSEICCTKEYFDDIMEQNGLKDIEVYEALPEKICGMFWCKVQHFCGDDSKDSCGKQCTDYAPRNKRSGCCKYYTTQLYIKGNKLTLNK